MRNFQFGLATALAAATCCLGSVSAVAEGCIPFLARQALDKVLRDSSQIFGIHGGSISDDTSGTIPSKPAANNSLTANWMSRHPDSTPLVHLSIPGTHDSATWNFSTSTRDSLAQNGQIATLNPAYFRSQRRSLRASLDAGIRFFDLRYSLDPTGTAASLGPQQQQLLFWHHEALLSQRTSFEHVLLFALPRWLAEHPGETVLVSLMAEGSTTAPRNDALAQRLLFDLLTSDAAKRFIHQRRGLPTSLGEARGKIALVRRFTLDRLAPEFDAALPGVHLPGSKWEDNGRAFEIVYDPTSGSAGKGSGSAYIEDYYEPSDLPRSANASANIAAKLATTEAHLRKAVGLAGNAGANGTVSDEHRNGLFITFASAEHTDADLPVFYEIMANGNGSAATPDGGVNHRLVRIVKGLLGGGERRRLGVVVLDFYDEPAGLVPAILGM